MLFLFLFLFVFSSVFAAGGIALIVVIAFVIIRRFSLLWLLRLPTGVGSLSLDSRDLIRDSGLLRFVNRDTTLGIRHDRISPDVKCESSVRVGLQDSRRNGIVLGHAASNNIACTMPGIAILSVANRPKMVAIRLISSAGFAAGILIVRAERNSA
jgi:hypothetical protein